MKMISLLTALMLLFVHHVSAEESNPNEWLFYPSIGMSFSKISFTRPAGTLNALNKTLNLGVTATDRNYYVNVQAELFGKSNFKNGNEFTSVEREDQTLTIGKIFKRSSMFIGYTDSETKDDFLGEFHFDKGLFLGGGYDFPVGNSRLGLTLAYASLDGKIFKDASGLLESGKTQGLSYGVSLSGPFRKDMGYKLLLRYRSYKFDSGAVVTDKNILSLSGAIIF